MRLRIDALPVPGQHPVDDEGMSKMPHAAFPAECRVRENAECSCLNPCFSAGCLSWARHYLMCSPQLLRQGEDMSTSTIFKSSSVIRRQHEGPLGIHIDAYEAVLGEHGYSRRSTYVHLHIVSDLNRWLKRRRLDVD